jgi:molybdopterin converting factor subunit 1
MRVRVKLFAVARQRAGRESVEVEIPAGATVRQLRGAMLEQVPALAEVIPHVRLAVNSQYAADGMMIPAGAEVAVIPPVSGG